VDGAFVKIADIPAGVVSYTDMGLAAATTYTYRLRAVKNGLYTDYSPEASATTGSVTGAGGGTGGTGGGGSGGSGGTGGTGGTGGSGTMSSDPNSPDYNGPGNFWVPCPYCGGSGWVHGGAENDLTPCPYCNHGEEEVVVYGFSATAISASAIKLDWIAVEAAGASYELVRKIGDKTDPGSYVKIADIAAGSTSYVDMGLVAGTTYTYRLRAVKGGLYSAYTQEASATTGSVDGAGGTGGSGGLGGGADASGFAAWALAHGLNPNTPYADSDGNGICDLEEYLMSQNADISGSPVAGFEIFSPMGDSVITVAQNIPAPPSVLLTKPMTSAASPAPYAASASSIWEPGQDAWNSFAQSTSFAPTWAAGGGANNYDANGYGSQWIKIYLGTPRTLTGMKLYSRNGYFPQNARAFVLEGSLDGISWFVIYTAVDGDVAPATAYRQLIFSKMNAFSAKAAYLRMTITRIWQGNTNASAGEIEYYGY